MGSGRSETYDVGAGGGLSECGGTFEFILLISDNIDLDFDGLKIGDNIKIKLVKGTLPKLEVVKTEVEKLIGLVPPSFSKLIKCIEEGWKYYGKIVSIEGDEIDSKICIKVKGEQ